MAHTRNAEDELVIDRRMGNLDRRLDGERRNEERLIYMKSECRNSIPRRNLDLEGTMVAADLWWSNNQQFY